MGKHPHPTTLSVAVTLPLRINSSKTRIMPGRTSGLDGHTVNTLWSIWKQRAVTKVTIGKTYKDPVNNKLNIIFHSKYFPVSDWLKPCAKFTTTSCC